MANDHKEEYSMSVIPEKRLDEYKQGGLYTLIHPKPTQNIPSHLIVTKLNSSSDKSNASQTEHKQETVPSTQVNTPATSNQPTDTPSSQQPSQPKLKVLDGDPTPAEPINKSNKPGNRKPNNRQTARKTNNQHSLNHNTKSKHHELTEAEKEQLFQTIRTAASTATFIEKAGIHVQLHNNLKKLVTKKIELRSVRHNRPSSISLDDRFFHLLSNVVIGKNLDIIFCFFDGTMLRIAPNDWVKKGIQIRKELYKNGYRYAYTRQLNIEQLQRDLHSMSAYVIDNAQFVQYWIPYYPIQPK